MHVKGILSVSKGIIPHGEEMFIHGKTITISDIEMIIHGEIYRFW